MGTSNMASTALVYLLSAAASINALTLDEDVLQFKEWKSLYGKEYETALHEEERFVQWKANKHMISNHNMTNEHFQLTLNEFADLSTEEFSGQRKMQKIDPREQERTGSLFMIPENVTLPKSVDWRNKLVTPIKDQGQCGSCYAFATTGALEASWAKATGNLQSFSEQQIVDCSGPEGDFGCNGGLPDRAFEYIKENGLELENVYRTYSAAQGRCEAKASLEVAKVNSWKDIESGNEKALEYAVATHGPVAVAIDANPPSFQLYKSGVYIEPACTHQIDHAVLVVGFG